MPKLSDVFLSLLGDALMGAGGQDPVAFRQNQEQAATQRDQFDRTLALKKQEEDRQRLATLAAFADKNNIQQIQPGFQGPLPEGGFRADLSSLGSGMGEAIVSPRQTSFIPFLQDESGKLKPQEPISVPKGSRPIVGRPPSSNEPQKPPPGYRWTPKGDQEVIPGGPADAKLQTKLTKEQGLKNAAIAQADTVIGKVDQALKGVSGWSTGWGAKLLGGLPATSAKNLAKDIDTIKANLGFSQLQEMRRNSPTGGALGQVAVQELEMLQAAIASLDPEQDDAQVIRNLNEVKKHFENWKKTLQQDGTNAGGTTTNPPPLLGERIRVRNKLTGKTGTISSVNMDESKYERL